LSEDLIQTKDLNKIYALGANAVNAIRGVSITIKSGEFVAIMGPSGSGKTTFMNILGCLDRPSSGRYLLDGENVMDLNGNELAERRNRKIGFVFQGFNLLPRTTAIENVELPLIYSGIPSITRKGKAREALMMVGLRDRMKHHPNQLSGGQQQRVAIARALVNNAPILLADEPTGNLDTSTGNEIMELFVKLNTEDRITVILVTHEQHVADYSGRIIRFLDGRVTGDRMHRQA